MGFQNPYNPLKGLIFTLLQRTTVLVPADGYVVIRFKADNPGLWLLHCHTLSHDMEGKLISLGTRDGQRNHKN